MGHKKVCLDCRKAFSLGTDLTNKSTLACPDCGKQATLFSHLFRPPKRDDIKKWKVVEFLKNQGFIYQHVYKEYSKSGWSGQLQYPETMEEAKEFVKQYKAQAYDLSAKK